MDRRLLLLLLVAILVIAATVPALGSRTTVAPTFDRKASAKALATARLALKDAHSALYSSEVAAKIGAAATTAAEEAKKAAAGAQEAAGNAKATADAAKGTADATQAALESTKTKTAKAAVTEETESESFVQLPGGPSLGVTVPDSGLIEVWAQATIEGLGGVSLYEDGQQMPGQAEECSLGTGGVLFSNLYPFAEPVATATPAGMGDCATQGPPGPVLFETAPGAHTYELRYGTCGCPEPVTFSDRLLVVGPRL